MQDLEAKDLGLSSRLLLTRQVKSTLQECSEISMCSSENEVSIPTCCGASVKVDVNMLCEVP